VKAKKKAEKPFDCVAFKRKAQSRIYRKIKGLSSDQEAAYFDQAVKSGPFAGVWTKLTTQKRKAV
jgi:hypothetical protein